MCMLNMNPMVGISSILIYHVLVNGYGSFTLLDA
jgi:hypothetical protein